LALQLYAELEDLDETEEEFRTRGIAGQAICYAHMNDAESAKKYLARVLDRDQQRLLNNDMRSEIERLIRQYRPE
jgi:hypothetical protein